MSDVTGYFYGLDQGSSPSTYVAASASTVTLTPDTGWHDLVVESRDRAGNVSAATHFLFGQGAGGFATPAQQTATGKNFVVTLNSTTGYDGFTLNYRRSESDSWNSVPTGDVTFQSSGTGIGSWPVECTGWTSCTGTTGHAYPALVWNATSTLGAEGPVQLQAVFWTGATSTSIVTSALNLTYDPNQFGSAYATSPIGPGSVNLLTGNYAISASDVSQGGLGIARQFNSRDPNNATGIFGPGWTTSAAPGDMTFRSLTDSTTFVTVNGSDGTPTTFRQQTNRSYVPEDSTSTLSLVKCTYGPVSCDNNVAGYFELKDLNQDKWTFQQPTGSSGDYMLVNVNMSAVPGTGSTNWSMVSTTAEPTQEVAPAPAGVSCATSPLTTRGCQTLTFTYGSSTTATGTAEANWGDYLHQLKTVSYTAWDPDLATPAMSTVDVASYLYDNTGHLRAAWDPRPSTPLKTRYGYNANGQILTLTPPGLEPCTFSYAPIGLEPSTVGRLVNVQRHTITGTSTVSGTATSTVVYEIPLTTGAGAHGPYDMLPADTAHWGQTDNPTDATAIYPPDQIPSGTPPSSYTRATVTYMDINGQTVNVAEPGDEITTSEQGAYGNTVRTLSAGNRQLALTFSGTALQAGISRLFDTQSVYDAHGLLTDTYGPSHVVDLPDGTSRWSRAHTHDVYDQGAPGGGTFDLVTTSTESAKPNDGTAEQDTRTTANAYSIGTNTAGWTLGSPLQTTVDPNPTGVTTHLNLTTTTLQDATIGQLTERRLPGNPSGGDAHATVFVYYTAGTNSQDTACGFQPEWVGLACKQAPAAQPGTSGLPNLKISYVTKYNMDGQPEETKDKDTTGTTLRTTTIGYDAVGRQITQTISGASGTGASVATSTTAYSTTTGLPTTTTDGATTITRAYDTLGRITSYTDADANTSTFTYDALDRPSVVNDGKSDTTYTYDDGTETRGLLTTVSDTSVGNFTATYNTDGQLATQVSPGGLTATYTYDPVGHVIDLKYSKGTGTWPDSTARYNIHGERTAMTSSLWSYSYNYDAAGRLTTTLEDNLFGCINRAYSFDADTNRTALVTTTSISWTPSPSNCPPSGTPTTTSHSYDSADRVTGTGYSYDSLGRTTAMPATDSPSGYSTMVGYYTNDLVNTIATNGSTLTYNLDPNGRAHEWISSADSRTHTNHYSGDTDRAAWTNENTGGATTWTRTLAAFSGMTATIDQSGAIALEFTNVHGDIVGTAATTDTTWSYFSGISGTDEYGRSSVNGAGSRYDYLGSAQRQRDTNSGLLLMGVRAYNPSTGRFLQTDPMLAGSANNYDYVGGDPVNKTDVTGRGSALITPLRTWGYAVGNYGCVLHSYGAIDPPTPAEDFEVLYVTVTVSCAFASEWLGSWGGYSYESFPRSGRLFVPYYGDIGFFAGIPVTATTIHINMNWVLPQLRGISRFQFSISGFAESVRHYTYKAPDLLTATFWSSWNVECGTSFGCIFSASSYGYGYG